MGYAYPVGDIYVPADYHNHCCERNPPSSEPGTDYASAYGTPVASPGPGTVVDLKNTNSSGTGRYVCIDLDDGRRARGLHLSAIYVTLGQRVPTGGIIAASGASGYGSDWYYGSHLHQTLWATQAYSFCSTCTIDFQTYVGGTTPPQPTPTPTPELIPTEVTMLLVQNKDTGDVFTVGQRYLHHVTSTDEGNVAANLYNAGVKWKKNDRGWIVLEKGWFTQLLKANGIPDSVQKDVLGGKVWQDGTLLSSSANSTVWTETNVWSGNTEAGAGALLGQGWDRAGKAATRSQEILDYIATLPPVPGADTSTTGVAVKEPDGRGADAG